MQLIFSSMLFYPVIQQYNLNHEYKKDGISATVKQQTYSFKSYVTSPTDASSISGYKKTVR